MSDEVRTTSDTGAKKGVKGARFDMLPADSLWELAEHFGKGAEKYETGDGGIDNWRLGYEWSKSYASLFRHAFSALGGEDVDPETQSKHLIAAAWHCLVLVHWMNDPSKARFDDRQATLETRGAQSAPLAPSQAHGPLMEYLGVPTLTPDPAGERSVSARGRATSDDGSTT